VSKVVGARRSVVLAEYNRMIDEIDASVLVQGELRKTDPTLASASSFLDVVTGGGTKRKRSVKEAEDVPATEGGDVPVATKVVDVLPPPSAKYLEKQRTTRILAAESLIRDELRKANPSETSIAAFRKAAYGDEGVPTTDVSGDMREEIIHTTEDTTPSLRVLPAVELAVEEGGCTEKLQEEEFMDAEIVAPDDTGMSIDESDEEKTISDGFSRSGDSSSESESVVSQGSRKRTAEESPEREPAETTRKSSPGTVTRSEAGCRIYVPPATPKEGAKESGLSVEVVEASGAKVVDASGAKVVEASGAKVVEASGAKVFEASGAKVFEASGAKVFEASGAKVFETTGAKGVETTVVVSVGAKNVGNDKLKAVNDVRTSLQKSTILGVATLTTVAMGFDSPTVPVCLIEAMNPELGDETEATRSISAAEAFLSMASSVDNTIKSGSVVPAKGTETCRMTVANADLETSDGTPGTTEETGEASLSVISAGVSLTGRNAMVPRDEVITLLAPVLAPTVPGRHPAVDGWARAMHEWWRGYFKSWKVWSRRG